MGKLDSYLQHLLSKQRTEHFVEELTVQSPIEENQVESVAVLVEFVGDIQDLKNLGLNVSTIAGNIAVATIDVDKLSDLANHQSVQRIELSQKLKAEMDYSLPDVIEGYNSQGYEGIKIDEKIYDGSEVLIGIIDSPINWSDASFTKDGQNKIIAIWDQADKVASISKPQGYTYGTEYKGEQLNAYVPSDHLHGTAVAIIAAGYGDQINNVRTGVAPNAEIIYVVNQTIRESYVNYLLDAINYIICTAKDKKKPVVINMSLGLNIGSHDGESLTEKAIDNLLCREGVVLIKSAGNEGGKRSILIESGSSSKTIEGYSHASNYSEGSTPEAVIDIKQLIWLMPDARNADKDITIYTEIWYEKDKTFEKIVLTAPDETEFTFEKNSTVKRIILPSITTLSGSESSVSWKLDTNYHTALDQLLIIFDIGEVSQNPGLLGVWKISVSFESNTQYDSWCSSNDRRVNVFFTGKNANENCTISFPGNSKKIITVGNYRTKNKTNENTIEVGDLSNSSSKGPTRDRRISPTLCAPGSVIRINSEINDLSGTSFAAPHVTGAVALMLQANPSLSQDDVRDILLGSCRYDIHTNSTPNNSWGYGKLNVKRSVRYAIPPQIIKFTKPEIKFAFSDKLIVEAANLFLPLLDIKDAHDVRVLMCNLGYDLPDIKDYDKIIESLDSFIQKIGIQLEELRKTLSEFVSSDESHYLVNLTKIVSVLFRTSESVKQFQDVKAEFDRANRANILGIGDLIATVDQLPRRLVDYLLYIHLAKNYPRQFSFLVMFGILAEITDSNTVRCNVYKTVNWNRLSELLSNPLVIVEAVYFIQDLQLASLEINLPKLEVNLKLIAQALKTNLSLTKQSETIKKLLVNNEADKNYVMLNLLLYSRETCQSSIESRFGIYFANKGYSGIAAIPYSTINYSDKIYQTDDWEFKANFYIEALLAIIVNILGQNEKNISVKYEGTLKPSLKVSQKKDKIYDIFKLNRGALLTVSDIAIQIYAALKSKGYDVGIELKIGKLELTLSTADGDSFLAKIIPNSSLKVTQDLTVLYSAKEGLSFKGSPKLQVKIYPHIKLGFLDITSLSLGIGSAADSSKGIISEIATTVKSTLGPLKITIEELGLNQILNFAEANKFVDDLKAVGPLKYDYKFKPPNGLELMFSTEAITGGGFLRINPELGEYRGALVLSFKKAFTLRAIALLNTKLPGGQPGFSLFVMITVEFQPVQLGYGFTLNAVGGLFGYNRTVDKDKLNEMVSSGRAAQLLFPPPSTDLNAIVNAAAEVYPVKVGNFVFGPMGKLGWGTPAIISAEIALIIEVPDPVRIWLLGVLRVGLPDTTAPTVQLNTVFVAVLDFAKREFSLRGSLFDSKVLTITLSGDFAMIISWGDQPMFIASAGGFHPAYREAPATLNQMQRLCLSLINEKNLKIGAKVYFAITSNTAQFGCHISLVGDFSGVTVDGHFWFDVLFIFNPFRFQAEIGLTANISYKGHKLAAVRVTGQLDGPGPWSVRAEVTFELLGWEYHKRLDRSWGAEQLTFAQNRRSTLLDELKAEVLKSENWSARPLPGTVLTGISVRDFSSQAELVIMPNCQLTFKQKLIPLEIDLQKFGEELITENKFTISSVGSIATQVTEKFARNNFFNLTNSEKLSNPSFENFIGGLEWSVNSDSIKLSDFKEEFKLNYEIKYVAADSLPADPGSIFTQGLLLRELQGSIAYESVLSREMNRPGAAAIQPILQQPEKFVILDKQTLLPAWNNGYIFNSYSEAEQAINLNALTGKDRLLIVSEFEI